jgi:hypothetical protein
MNTTRLVFLIAMSLVFSIFIASLVSVLPANGGEQKKRQLGSYWTANLEMRTLGPGLGSGAQPADSTSRRGSEIVLRYRVYQNPRGIARHELVSSPPLTVIGVGRDVHIIDFNNGTLVAFDKAGTTAVRSRLLEFERNRFAPQSIPIGKKIILGYECTGVEFRSQDPNAKVNEVRQAWVATGIDFREPLIETIKRLDSNEQPISITEKVITQLQPAQHLDSSLFRVPNGYKITDAGSLNGNREGNPVASASDRPPATVQSRSKKAPADDHSAFCEDERKRVQDVVQEIFREYRRGDSPRPIELLVDLDYRIRALLNSRPPYRPCGDDSGIYDRQLEEIGVNLGYWVDLEYSGKLLYEGHKRNPNSPLRRYTLFSTIFGATLYHGLGVIPDIKAAFNYASEFPDGPFAKETFRIIADFHKDLFMVLRDNDRDYKYDCFKPYITSDTIKTQKELAKRTALKYYRKALEIEPSNQAVRTFLNDVDNETVRAWSFCAD